MPTLRKKLKALRYFSCLFSHWEEQFINDVWEGIDGTHDSLHDEAIKDYLHENQIEKIKEIWNTYSPHFDTELTEKVRELMERSNFKERWQTMPGTRYIPANTGKTH